MRELRDIIAENICALRTERGMTQSKLAEVLNYSDKAVSKWERGESVPDVSVLKQIADFFGVNVDYLLSEIHPEKKEIGKENIKRKKTNHFLISSLAVVSVWVCALVIFISLAFISDADIRFPWLSFIYAIPCASIVAIVFNSMWGKRALNFLFISILLWSVILTVYLTILAYNVNIWALFLLGVPSQIIVFLCIGIKKMRRS